MVVGMTYKMQSDVTKLNKDVVKGELLMCSIFDKVYVNSTQIDGSYILLMLREESKSHDGRMQISYSPKLTYGEIQNDVTIEKMRKAIGCSKEGCWFVHDISIKNQDELHFSAIIVDRDNPTVYQGTSQERSRYWKSLIGDGFVLSEPSTDYKPYNPYLTAIRTKPFVLLAGISGTGKSRIVRELAFKSCPVYLRDNDGTTPGNYCMIEVKPNWHDSTELLGYYSNLTKGYQFTRFVRFLVKAKMFPDVPFFVCLDEMNLAPVEQYFAEVLSVLETRKHVTLADGREAIKTGAIVEPVHFRKLLEMPNFHTENGGTFSVGSTDRDIYLKLFSIDTESDIDSRVGNRTDLTTEGLTLPDNVVIIGTVNMDDTTHQFSRKVIDRAMTIEMNGGRLMDMFGDSHNLEYLPDDEQRWWQQRFRQHYVSADEVLQAYPGKAGEIKTLLTERLEAINRVLHGTPFEVSYRVLNELTVMLGVMLDDEPDAELRVLAERAVDNILLMKILPRIEGDSDMFALSAEYRRQHSIHYDNRLEWLRAIAPDLRASEAGDTDLPDGGQADAQDAEPATSARDKIQEMVERLGNQEFTRFWP